MRTTDLQSTRYQKPFPLQPNVFHCLQLNAICICNARPFGRRHRGGGGGGGGREAPATAEDITDIWFAFSPWAWRRWRSRSLRVGMCFVVEAVFGCQLLWSKGWDTRIGEIRRRSPGLKLKPTIGSSIEHICPLQGLHPFLELTITNRFCVACLEACTFRS